MIATLRAWWERFKERHIIADVPPELDACETCRVLDCDASTAAQCGLRLKAIEAAKKPTGSN